MADPVVHITNGVPDSGTGNITTLGQVLSAIQSLAGALFAKITDGTNTAAVKAASTAPTASDPALVVAISPNGQLTGSQTSGNCAPVVIASDQAAVAMKGDAQVGTAESNSLNPVKQGFYATNDQTALTLVSNAQRANGVSGLDGAQITRPHTNLESITNIVPTSVTTSSTQLLAAGATGVKRKIMNLNIVNTTGTAGYLSVLDGATEIDRIPVGANGTIMNYPLPVSGSAATALNAQAGGGPSTLTVAGRVFNSKI